MNAELRLRQWARRNYIPLGERDDSDWHPIVLDEMRSKDRELGLELLPPTPVQQQDGERLPTIVTSVGIVPLEPSRHDDVRIDRAHAAIPAPRLRQTTPSDSAEKSETFIPYYL